jgi:hypothetical protein
MLQEIRTAFRKLRAKDYEGAIVLETYCTDPEHPITTGGIKEVGWLKTASILAYDKWRELSPLAKTPKEICRERRYHRWGHKLESAFNKLYIDLYILKVTPDHKRK